MNIVLDSNILFSALIRNSTTRKLILEYDNLFLFPSYIFDELEKHKDELLQKSKIDSENFEELLQLLLQKVIIVSEPVLNRYKERALDIIKNIDTNDAVFVACALAYPQSVIWSDDAQLKKQHIIKILNTVEMIAYFESNS